MKKNLLTVFSAIVLSQGLQAQVSAYTFTQTTGTYAPVTGTDLFGATWNDNVSAALPLGFTFQFNAVPYTSVTVSSNGFVTFGTTAPTTTNFLPISNTTAYAGAISAFGRDLSAATATSGVSYTVTGVSPNRKFVVQWENAKRINGDAANFQIILNETSNRVDLMYGACTATATANTSKVQVGLRGAANTDYNNRFGANTTAWASTTAGAANTDAVNYRNTVLPASGLTLSWLAPACFPASGLANTGVSSSTATFSWTSVSGTNFDVYYGTTPLATPNATTVPTATTSASSFTASGLTPSTAHAIYVRNNCGAGNVSSWSPATSFMTLCSAPPVSSTTGNFRCGIGTTTLGATTTAGATLNWYTAPTGGGSVATGSVFTTPTITTTTNYYVSATGGLTTLSAGITSASGSSSYVPLGDGLRFNATQSFTLNSVDVYSNDAASGIVTIELQNSSGTVLNSYNMTIPPGAGTTPVTVPVNFVIAPGTGYYLVATDGPDIIFNASGVSYPYPIGSVGSITSGYDAFGGNSSAEYFYFFNWQISTACEGPRSVVTATVNAPLPLTLSAATAVCANVISTVSVTSTASNYDSYIWSPATNLYTDAAATIPYAGGSATVLYYKSATANTTVYSVNATNSVSGCANIATVSRATDSPVISAAATPSVFCAGSTSTLVASSVSTGTAAVGTSTTTTSNQGITPYGSNWEGSRQQYLIRASELTAANIYAGNLTSLSFSVTAQGGGAFSQSNFTIKLAHTANTALNAAYGTPTGVFTTVYGPATQALPPLGLNMYTFSTPFNWDGVSNILVDICHDNDPGATCTDCYSSNSTVTYNTTSFNSTWASYNDDEQSCGVQAANTLSGSFTNRPNMTFGGQVLNASGAGLNWVWNPGGVTTNTTAVTPVNTGTNPSVATYTVTGTNAATTCSNSAVVSVTVNPVPSTPVAANSIQCGLGIPTASVSGGTSYKWYATPTGTTAIQSGASQTYTTSIGSTTNFYVSSFNGTCESPRAMLTASVTTPDAVTATSTSTAICPGQSFTLTAASTNSAYSYTWTATPAAGSGIATSVTGATTVVMPTTAGTYNYLVTAFDGVCTTTAGVQATLNAAPNVATTNTMICAGSSAVLTATSTGIGAGTATIGTNALTDYTGGPYRQGAATDNKAQWLFTAAELSAANIAAGNITSLSFSVPAGSADIMNNFSVRIGTTTATSLAATFDANATSLVYGPSPVSAATGLNTYTFSVPFNWNGTSNIIIEVCHDIVVAGGGSTAVTRQSISNRTLYSNVAGACAQTAGTAVAYRPVVILAAQTATNVSSSMNWVWNPGAVSGNTISVSPPNTGSSPIVQMYTVTATNPVTSCTNSASSSVTVNPVPSVTVAASTGSICSGTTASLTASGATTYTWMPAGGTSSVAVVSPASTTVYTVTGTSSGCSNTQTVNLNVTATPTVVASASPTVICAGATVSLTASGASTYSWMPNSSTSGTTTATPTISTTYTVSGTTAGCTNTKTLSVAVNNVPTLTVTTSPASGVLCTAGASATLAATGTSTAYAWSNGALTSSVVVTPPTGPTSFTVAGTNSCGTRTAVVTVTAGVTPTITAMTSATVSCPGNPAVLTANATPGVTFLWNTTSTTASITVTPTMTTTYTVTASNVCGTATTTVVQNVIPCTGLEEVTNGSGISIYPNPANDYVNIAVPANLASANTSVEVTDALGKVVIRESINTDVTTLRITELKDGIYFFKVISNNQTVKVGKVVKH